jgi:hypothetical protein
MSDLLVYKKTALTGGGATALDGVDGAALVDGNLAFVTYGNIIYHYILDDDSAAAESSPDVIAPDTNPGNKRWILQRHVAALSTAKGVVELDTDAEALTGTDTERALTAANLKHVLGHEYTYPIQEIVEYSRAQNCPTLLIEAFLTTPSSANLKAAVSDETGSGALVFANTPTLVTPLLGTPTSGDLRNCTGPTATTKGAVELDTDAEAVTGTDTERALTAANLKAVLGHDYTYPIQEIVEYSEAQ